METHAFDFPAGAPARTRALAGVVASGDLEILLEPGEAGRIHVAVATSTDGAGQRWAAVLERVLGDGTFPAARLDISDFGATPGVVRLRLGQAFGAAGHAQEMPA